MEVAEKPAEVSKTKDVAETQLEVTNLFELICRRAYKIYGQRGCTHGNDVDHWLQAEAEVRANFASEVSEQNS
jgi:Protein of unknown function (DUF2934)